MTGFDFSNDMVRQYLVHFGYASENARSLTGPLKKFQKRFGLEADGEVSEKDLRAMHWPRCGLADHAMMSEEARWRKNHLKWYVASYVNGLDNDIQNKIFEAAFNSWAMVAGVTFEWSSTKSGADIVISRGNGRADGFDGPSGTLAWAELPNGSDRQLNVKFDLAETWISDPRLRGILLLNVAAHEFGHSLGLDHSRVNTALMAPYYSAGISGPQPNDDVSRIRSLYGPAKEIPPENVTEYIIRVKGAMVVDNHRLIPMFTE